MTAKIIKLERFNIGCRHHANGVRFPHLYRVTGFEYDLLDEGTANARFVPGSSVPVEPSYTLSDRGDFGVANPTFQPIRSLRPDLDKGWIIVRHHASPEGAHAYIDCVGDYRPIPYDYSGPMIWQTSAGIFTPPTALLPLTPRLAYFLLAPRVRCELLDASIPCGDALSRLAILHGDRRGPQ